MKQSAGILVLAIALFFSLTLACTGSAEQTDEAENVDQAKQSDGLWTLVVPEGFVQTLFTEEMLTDDDEQCWECILGDLERGIRLKPLSGGCQRPTWDQSFVFCEVQVMSGDLTGTIGWVNQKFIEKG